MVILISALFSDRYVLIRRNTNLESTYSLSHIKTSEYILSNPNEFQNTVDINEYENSVIIGEYENETYVGLYEPIYYFGRENKLFIPKSTRYFNKNDYVNKTKVSAYVLQSEADVSSLLRCINKKNSENNRYIFCVDRYSRLYTPGIYEIKNLAGIETPPNKVFFYSELESEQELLDKQ